MRVSATLGWWYRFDVTRFSSSMTARLAPSLAPDGPTKAIPPPRRNPVPIQISDGEDRQQGHSIEHRIKIRTSSMAGSCANTDLKPTVRRHPGLKGLMGSDLSDPVRQGRRTGAPMDGFMACQTDPIPLAL